MPDRFPPEVAATLTAAGWTDGRQAGAAAAAAVAEVTAQVGRYGARTESFPGAEAVVEEFAGLHVEQDGPGVDLRRRAFTLDPTAVAASAETLADFGRVLGARLFPVGMEGEHESILAVDESGRTFALDDTGEWHLGDSFDAGLTTLITGVAPARVRDDGTW